VKGKLLNISKKLKFVERTPALLSGTCSAFQLLAAEDGQECSGFFKPGNAIFVFLKYTIHIYAVLEKLSCCHLWL